MPPILPLLVIEPPRSVPAGPSYVSEICEAIGRMILTWGRMEQHLAHLQRMAMNIAGRTGPNDHLKVAFGRCLDQLNDIYSSCPALQRSADDMSKLSKHLRSLSLHRDRIIHSSWQEFNDGPPPQLILRHAAHPRGKMLGTSRIDLTPALLEELIKLIESCHRLLFTLITDAAPLQPGLADIHKSLEQSPKRSGGRSSRRPPTRL